MDTVQLHNNNCTAVILLQGAQLASLQVNGREIMWQADPAIWGEHGPVLFPVCGALTGDRVLISGTDYAVPKHGFAKDAVFTIADQTAASVDLLLTSSDATLAVYPFHFALHVIYTLTECGITTTFHVENHSDVTMPFCIGGHPAFIVPMEPNAAFEDYQIIFPSIEDGKNSLVVPGGLIDGFDYLPNFHNTDRFSLDHQMFDKLDSLVFTELKSRSLQLLHPVSGKGLQLDFPQFEVLVIWSMPNKLGQYVCLEPWHGMPGRVTESGAFVDKPFATLLPPAHHWQASYSAKVIG